MELKVEGIVKGINQKQDKYGIVLDNDLWYNGKGQCPVLKEAKVKVSFFENKVGDKTFRNIVNVERILSSEQAKISKFPSQKDGLCESCVKFVGDFNNHLKEEHGLK